METHDHSTVHVVPCVPHLVVFSFLRMLCKGVPLQYWKRMLRKGKRLTMKYTQHAMGVGGVAFGASDAADEARACVMQGTGPFEILSPRVHVLASLSISSLKKHAMPSFGPTSGVEAGPGVLEGRPFDDEFNFCWAKLILI